MDGLRSAPLGSLFYTDTISYLTLKVVNSICGVILSQDTYLYLAW
jgi:hypothetical protein